MNTDELISATKKQAQYLALQNQINPHFLYNTLEGIRGETLNAGLDNVAKMTEALATFFVILFQMLKIWLRWKMN